MTDERFSTDEHFEHDLRAVLDAMAPRQVPEALRIGLAEIAVRATLAPGPRLERGRWLAGAVAVLVLLAVAGLAVIVTRPTAGPGSAIPTPLSSLVSGFVEQTDGVYGYRMLRPANWTPLGGDFPDGRMYLGPGAAFDQQGIRGIVVSVVNLALPGASVGPASSNELWLIFERDPTLAGWTAGLESRFTRGGSSVTLLRELPDAKIYSITNPAVSSYVFLAAYAVDHGQPLILHLMAGGTDADLGRLEAQGVVDDFATMVQSITAIPADPLSVEPALPTQEQQPAPS